MLKTVALTPADFNRWAEHMNRQIAESGRDGRPFFSPMEAIEFASIERRARFENGLAKPVFEPTWLRMWAIEGPDACLIAHLDLSGSNIPTEQHRATLGIGVEEVFLRQGYGRKLMVQAIEFAQHNHIEWLDLSVFSENKAAICLYLSLGFEEVGRRNDRFRIFGRSVDDVTMTLRLKG
ncbi:GNAT family N-acetyltransferase [Paraburkholderia youngii]|uniref:RimJ/RimL family protein N-acetyltransferase n=1 Tax=Paraburkholderia youngii TaxID=2782701 RepID=A0A7W8P3U3_9BURK|nr:GNAT family protein [Paraburkholderia youngii]MBB5402586.1 RimJ/RimL family protein N-acetyltransferase [Paraburkholderia youngii]